MNLKSRPSADGRLFLFDVKPLLFILIQAQNS
jgi:hypothetical protein